MTAPSVTPSVNGAAHLVFSGRDSGDSNGGSVFGFPAPLTKEWERKTGTTATDRSTGAGLRILVGGAGSPTGTVTVTNQTGFGATTWGAVTIAIKPAQSGPTRNQTGYSYLGAKQRHTTLAAGTIEMGARVYVPQLGRFLQVDPVYGGSSNAYEYAYQDPVNITDLDGECPICGTLIRVGVGLAIKHLKKSGGKSVTPRATPTVRGARTQYVVGQLPRRIGVRVRTPRAPGGPPVRIIRPGSEGRRADESFTNRLIYGRHNARPTQARLARAEAVREVIQRFHWG